LHRTQFSDPTLVEYSGVSISEVDGHFILFHTGERMSRHSAFAVLDKEEGKDTVEERAYKTIKRKAEGIARRWGTTDIVDNTRFKSEEQTIR